MVIDNFFYLVVFVVVVCYCSFCCVGVELVLLILVVSYVICVLEEWLGVGLFYCIICSVVLIEVG